MTSIEWLIEKLGWNNRSDAINRIVDEAKEMHKTELGKTWDSALDKYEVRAGNYMRGYEDFDDYFKETFVSNGSDDHIADISKMVEDETQPATYKIDIWTSFHHNKERIINAQISDEEIENAVLKEYENVGDEKLFPSHTDKDIWMKGFYEGVKWYKEQLKQRQ
jgi:hypothetical protein